MPDIGKFKQVRGYLHGRLPPKIWRRRVPLSLPVDTAMLNEVFVCENWYR